MRIRFAPSTRGGSSLRPPLRKRRARRATPSSGARSRLPDPRGIENQSGDLLSISAEAIDAPVLGLPLQELGARIVDAQPYAIDACAVVLRRAKLARVSQGRRGREVWAQLSAEVDDGDAVAAVAQRWRVGPGTLSWWRWQLRRAVPNKPRFLAGREEAGGSCVVAGRSSRRRGEARRRVDAVWDRTNT